MEYQKISNLLESTSDSLSKFRTRNWVEVNDESRGNYANSDIRFKTTMLRSNLCDYADSYILVKGAITITGAGGDEAARQADERDKGVAFRNCAPFTNCISRINNYTDLFCQMILKKNDDRILKYFVNNTNIKWNHIA